MKFVYSRPSIPSNVTLNNPIIKKLCKRCGVEFEGTKATRRCAVCRKIVKALQIQKSNTASNARRKLERLKSKAQ